VKALLRDALIVAVAATGLPFARLALLKRRGPVVRVLTVHDLGDGDERRLDGMLRFLRGRFTLISPEDLDAGRLDGRRVNVLLTFDDGYASWRTKARPVLERHGVRPIFFLCSGFLDTAGDQTREAAYCSERLRVRHRRPLSWEDAAALAEHGAIGGHTVSHPQLALLPAEEQRREIAADKEAIERRLGGRLRHFAYPFGMGGDVDARTAEAVARAGYELGFGSTAGFADGKGGLLIPRLNVDPDRSLLLLYLSVIGAYDLFRGAVDYFRRARSRS
jgi:peptidoglycan/xylan/chitin deacetylase (PgdA/CDA1 family)